jgi:cytoplasmic iron level regulating protein YaaA (DUF328/UPF0246 family)
MDRDRYNRLLILSCSKRKRRTPSLLSAIDRYDGPAFRTLRKWRPHNERIEVIILSAKYGFISGDLPIRDYDQIMPRRVTPQRKSRYRHQISQILAAREFDTAFINLGRDYAACLVAFEEISVKVGEVVSGSGRIGQRLHQLKSWLTSKSVNETC